MIIKEAKTKGRPRNPIPPPVVAAVPGRASTAINNKNNDAPAQQRRGGVAAAPPAAPPEPHLQLRPVANCLSCGKIYDQRKVLSSAEVGGLPGAAAAAARVSRELRVFLETGGCCVFCGSAVNIVARGTAPLFAPLTAAGAVDDDSIATAVEAGMRAAAEETARAADLKDRLVGYDRNSAKRTAVVDDQSDFFEIDTNAWLTDQEREELKRRQKLDEDAEDSRRRRITVSFDLVGRKVIVASDDRDHDLREQAPTVKVEYDSDDYRSEDGDEEGFVSADDGYFTKDIGVSNTTRNPTGPTGFDYSAEFENLDRHKASGTKAAAAVSGRRNDGPSSSSCLMAAEAGGKSGQGSGAPLPEGVLKFDLLENLRNVRITRDPSILRPAATVSSTTSPSPSLSVAPVAVQKQQQQKLQQQPSSGPKLSLSAPAFNPSFGTGAAGDATTLSCTVMTTKKNLSSTASVPGPTSRAPRESQAASTKPGQGGATHSRPAVSAVGAVGHGDHRRLQFSFMDEFDKLSRETMAVLEQAERQRKDRIQPSYDICPAVPLAPPSAGPSPLSGLSSPALPPGVVLLRGFLSLGEQVAVVRRIRTLGLGPGGFYQPTYEDEDSGGNRDFGGAGMTQGGGGAMHLRMMSLGWHWEPRERTYTKSRSYYDDAEPPPLPSWIDVLTQRAWAEANRLPPSGPAGSGRLGFAAAAAAPAPVASASSPSAATTNFGSDSSATVGHGEDPAFPDPSRSHTKEAVSGAGAPALPPIRPDVCLVNFYEPRRGSLGMHQDKDESRLSLRRGVPVVSFSIGDSCEFTLARTRAGEGAVTLRLESGDALLFGGPARLLFHGVNKVLPRTAPPELLALTGLRPGRLNLTVRQHIMTDAREDR